MLLDDTIRQEKAEEIGNLIGIEKIGHIRRMPETRLPNEIWDQTSQEEGKEKRKAENKRIRK